MRLITHNLLACNARNCITTSNNFPLKFNKVQLELIEADLNEDFLRGFMPKIEWKALVEAAREVRSLASMQTKRRANVRFIGSSETLPYQKRNRITTIQC
jgi:hypothetical protein